MLCTHAWSLQEAVTEAACQTNPSQRDSQPFQAMGGWGDLLGGALLKVYPQNASAQK